jgi:hypothetical protein
MSPPKATPSPESPSSHCRLADYGPTSSPCPALSGALLPADGRASGGEAHDERHDVDVRVRHRFWQEGQELADGGPLM